MQQHKGIKNLNEIARYSSDSSILLKTFENIIGQFKVSQVNTLLNNAKSKGVKGENIFRLLFTLCFVDIKNISQFLHSGFHSEFKNGKDVLYDFLKNEWIDWSKILSTFTTQFLKIVQKRGDDTDIKSPKCIILDDTLILKSGKKIEQIGKVFDHCTHKYLLGIKTLVCGFWDGKSFIPLSFSIHNEPSELKNRGLKPKELENQFSKSRHKDSHGQRRIDQIALSKISMGIEMVKNAIKNGIKPVYVLADSWFICEEFISKISSIKVKYAKNIHVLGIMKTNRKITISGKEKMANLIPELNRQNTKYCSKYKCFYIAEKVEYKGNEIKAFWIRMKGQEEWKMLISTDINLSFTNAMKYYQIRWSIEVFFKECKQNLGLNNCQFTDFDAHIAWTTLTFISYTILALRKRFDDYETMGEIFRDFKNELLEITLVEKLWNIIHLIYFEVFADLGVDLEVFLSKLLEKQESILSIAKINFSFLMHPSRNIV